MTTLDEMARQFGFNPGQLRGPDGKWIHLGAAVKHATHGTGVVTEKHHLGKVSVRFDRKGLKKVSGSDLSPDRNRPEEPFDPVTPQTRAMDRARENQDRADEEAAHRRAQRQEAADRADEEAAYQRGKRQDAAEELADRLHPNRHDRAAERSGSKRLGDLVKELGGEKEIERRAKEARTRRLDNLDHM